MSDRKWVVNASPVILLADVGHVKLLTTLCPTLVIPETVAKEIHAGPYEDTAQRWLNSAGQKYIHPVQSTDVTIAGWDLGAGESAVLTWAHSHQEYEAILDDRAARDCAVTLNIPVRGTLGVVLLAKRAGLIPQVRPVFDLIVEAGLRITPDVLQTALRLADE